MLTELDFMLISALGYRDEWELPLIIPDQSQNAINGLLPVRFRIKQHILPFSDHDRRSLLQQVSMPERANSSLTALRYQFIRFQRRLDFILSAASFRFFLTAVLKFSIIRDRNGGGAAADERPE